MAMNMPSVPLLFAPLVLAASLAPAVPAQGLAVAISTPTANETVGGTVEISGTAAGVGGGRVSISIDGGPFLAAQGTTNWTFDWDTDQLAEGPHTITARARTRVGGPSATDTIGVEVTRGAGILAVSIQTPRAGATLFDTTVVAGTSDAATQVELRVDQDPFFVVNGVATWEAVLEPASLTPGAHTLTARALRSGESVTDTITITVGPPPPGGQRVTYPSSVDGTALGASLWVPRGFDPGGGPRPLIIYLHGAGGDGSVLLRAGGGALTEELDARGWIGVGPDGRAWGLANLGCPWRVSAGYVDNPDPDVGPGEQDILDAIDWACRNFPIDKDRIYLSGFSMGGRGTYILGLRNPDLFAAIAPLGPAIDMFEVFDRRPEPRVCKEGITGGVPGDSPRVDTMYKITSGRFLIENAYNLPVFHGHGLNDTVTSNTLSNAPFLHGWHITTDSGFSGCHGDPALGLCFGHTPTLAELAQRHPDGYAWARLFQPVPHITTREMISGASIQTPGIIGVSDPLDPSQYIGAVEYLSQHQRQTAPNVVVYKTYTDDHSKAYWLDILSATPWSSIPAAVRAVRDPASNRYDIELVRAAQLTLDIDASSLTVNPNRDLVIDVRLLDEPTFDPALAAPGELLQPVIRLVGDFAGLDGVTATADGAPLASSDISFATTAIDLGPVTVTATRTRLIVRGLRRFTDLGQALSGALGTPTLSGSGELLAGSTTSFAISNARASAPGVLFLGTRRLDAPLLGGTLVPSADFFVATAADAAGEASITFPWPAGLSPEFQLFTQAWLFDPTGPLGASATNALRVTPLR